MVFGKFNNWRTNSLFSIGNGTNDSNRSNALTLDWEGNLEIMGKLKCSEMTVTNNISLESSNAGVILTSKSGNKYKLIVEDDGTLVTEKV